MRRLQTFQTPQNNPLYKMGALYWLINKPVTMIAYSHYSQPYYIKNLILYQFKVCAKSLSEKVCK